MAKPDAVTVDWMLAALLSEEDAAAEREGVSADDGAYADALEHRGARHGFSNFAAWLRTCRDAEMDE